MLLPTHELLGILNIGVGVIYIGLSLPLAFKKVGPNKYYGFRFKKSYMSEDLWFKINLYGAKCLIGWAVVVIGFGVWVLGVFNKSPELDPPLRHLEQLMMLSMVPSLGFIAVIQSYMHSKKL